MGKGIIVKNNQSMQENNVCCVWSKDEAPFPSENQLSNVIPWTAAAQLATCSSTDGVGMQCGGAAGPLSITHSVTILHNHLIPSSLVSLSLDVQGSVLPRSAKLYLLTIWQDAFVLGTLLGPSTDWGLFPEGLMLTDRYLPIPSRK